MCLYKLAPSTSVEHSDFQSLNKGKGPGRNELLDLLQGQYAHRRIANCSLTLARSSALLKHGESLVTGL